MPTIHAFLNSWCSGKTMYLQGVGAEYKRNHEVVYMSDYVILFDDGTIIILENPEVVQRFFDRYGSRKFDDSDTRALLANEVWSMYLLETLDQLKGHKIEHIWCDFHPFSGSRYQQLIRNQWVDQVYTLESMPIVEHALINAITRCPEYYSTEFRARSVETRGCVDVDAESDVPCLINSHIPKYYWSADPYRKWQLDA